MAVGIYPALLLAMAFCVRISDASDDPIYNFSSASMPIPLRVGSKVDFVCQVGESETAVLKIANKTLSEAKHEAWKHVTLGRKNNGQIAECIAKDSRGKVLRETKHHLNVWFPPILANHFMKHHYKLMVGHPGHVSIHFLTNPPISNDDGHVKVRGPKGHYVHNFRVVQVAHHHHNTDHFVILPFHEMKKSDFGIYTVSIASAHFPNHTMTQNFTIFESEVNQAPEGSNGGVIAAIVIGTLLTVGLIGLMAYFIMRSHKRQPLTEARRPIVTAEGGPGNDDGLDDDVFAESRPGSSHVESIDHTRM